MLDLAQELRNYPAMDINILAKDVDGIPDNVRNSIVLYNKALEDLRMKSEDIAIIGLKRAVAMNPNFYEAMNLLGICYTYIKDYAKAAEMFEKAASHENNGGKAMEYLNSLQGQNRIDTMREKGKNTRPEAIKKELHSNLPGLDSAKIKTEKNISKYLGCFAAGILVALFITGILNHDGKNVKASSVIEPAPNTVPRGRGKKYRKRCGTV